MAEVFPLTKETVHIHLIDNKVVVQHDVYEGEARMSQEQQDAYKQLIGDGKARVTVSKELSEADYGKGGKVHVSVTLTVDQSAANLQTGIAWAQYLADQKAWEAHAAMRQQLIEKGIIR